MVREASDEAHPNAVRYAHYGSTHYEWHLSHPEHILAPQPIRPPSLPFRSDSMTTADKPLTSDSTESYEKKFLIGLAITCAFLAVLALNIGSIGNRLPTDANSAQSYVVGTWTGDEALDSRNRLWSKYEFRPDGTFDLYIANAADNGWPGAPLLTGSWSIGEGKYTDSGARYLAVDLRWRNERGQPITARYPIVAEGIRKMAGFDPFSQEQVAMLTRGDNFPR